MASVQITCIRKSTPNGGHSHITHVGNPAASWMWEVEKVVESIDRKTNTFFVKDPVTSKVAYVGVVREPNKRPYLRTYADGLWNDNLLSLNFCPLMAA